MSLLKELNNQYLGFHTAKEESFWTSKMGLKGYKKGSFETNEIALQGFITDASWIPKIEDALVSENLTIDEKIGLQGWLAFFKANAIANDDAKELMNKIIEMEGELARTRGGMKLGYIDPETGEFVAASSVQLRLIVSTDKNPAKRKAALEGLKSIGTFVLENGFLEVVKERNKLGKLLGYEDYYDWKVNLNEGMSKAQLFELLDELKEETASACEESVNNVKNEKGADAILPWNFEFSTGGDLTSEKDPYLDFDSAVERWGRSFSAMNIKYQGANLTLDLLDRKGKYENGFMHGPFPAFVDEGTFRPAKINFTANAVAGQPGSGQKALATLFHEGGHAAHFSNIKMPAPCFAQEFAPTSIAFAETQSMFLDSICDDPDWLSRYAKDRDGNVMPFELIEKILEENHLFRAYMLRKLMIVPYAERAIYEMSEAELTPENVLASCKKIEREMSFQDGDSRPVLSVPHLLAGESSAYYHGYVLALMAVYQTRAFFLKRDGYIMDNPKVGDDLANKYWKPGNSKTFLTYIEELTSEPFSAKATVELVNKSFSEVLAEAKESISKLNEIPSFEGEIELDAKIRLIHGDDEIASIEKDGSFAAMTASYAEWVQKQ